MRSYVYAAGIIIQFFTVLPLHRTLPMDKAELKAVLHLFPLLGIVKGLLYATVFWGLIEWSPFSPLSIAFLVWLLPIILTGGLHLDGWIDWADAHFSYRDKEKRLSILNDPRAGAFGVLALVILLVAKFIFIYETVQAGSLYTDIIVLIPLFAQILTGLFLQYVPPAKTEGLSAFFQKGHSRTLPYVYSFFLIIAAFFYIWQPLFWIMAGASWMYFVFVKQGMQKEFGGTTGDLLGAAHEGAELLLWMIVWLSVSFATG
ncbi:adenosylcobinamide-GDP ribazoletransferase [Domibacillus sp. A3M-37]|uniref:adenosylcobinamide-GDP ribazoletransferase n=1 Tax=Domibacillus sp. A3M-37 TaxID=2962037 RepID=UPI0020B7D4B5|nr:adenosylcobinamide-GDP ribazoletransferase [Domibacillus sp. A3M-37]MCP3762207.1 adenosylcobinamide-GDP ribazoletransferase [Domibacillus sp. A3M-37]